MLVRAISSAKDRETADPHLDLILKLVRRVDGEKRDPETVEAALKEAFLGPLQPFVVREELPVRQAGRIRDESVDAVWTWFKRDVARTDFATARDTLSEALEEPEIAAEQVAKACRDKVVPLGRRYIERLSSSEDEVQRLAGQLGNRKTLEDVRDVLDIFEHLGPLDSIMAQTPDLLEEEDEPALRAQAARIAAFADRHPRHLHLLAIRHLDRVESRAVLVRLACLLVKSRSVPTLEKSVFRPFVDVAWSEIERAVEIVRNRQNGIDRDGTVEEALLDLHMMVRRCQMIIDVEGMTDWGRRLSHCRSQTSDILKESVEATPGLVRRALQPRQAEGRLAAPDPDCVDEAREALKVLRAARKAIDSLALNDLVSRVRAHAEQVIENGSKGLIDRLRDAPEADREVLASIVEGGIEFARIVFDENYADLLRRSLHVATHNPSLKSA